MAHVVIKSPMVGIFRQSKLPIEAGAIVKRGDVVCYIEAMGLFNEIEAEFDSGRITNCLVTSGSRVEYNQPLFVLEQDVHSSNAEPIEAGDFFKRHGSFEAPEPDSASLDDHSF